jgi:hypothetical protein
MYTIYLRNIGSTCLIVDTFIEPQAAPTQALMAHQAFKEKKAKLATRTTAAIEAKYGNAAAEKPDANLLLPASETYVEYDRTCVALLVKKKLIINDEMRRKMVLDFPSPSVARPHLILEQPVLSISV